MQIASVFLFPQSGINLCVLSSLFSGFAICCECVISLYNKM